MKSFEYVPERIRLARQAKGLSQENMADALHISTTAYGDLERGKTELTLSRLASVCAILEIPIAQLLSPDQQKQAEAEWLKEENRRLHRENMELTFKNELLQDRLKKLLAAGSERERIGF
ncbi:hypothetical protein GCM10023091_42870 [Ravibacter arvi]|uniref:HTH cro/C1-type domain-containing protein n=1 Tax=Ravibacter arvi TaxID=2051041 RepID=A0ABP8ME27_9BACT